MESIDVSGGDQIGPWKPAASSSSRSARSSSSSVGERRIARLLAGAEPEAASLILEEYGSTLRGYLASVLGDQRQLAEDVLQQVLLQAWQTGGSFDPSRGSLLGWLMMIARSRAIDTLRRRGPEPRDPQAAGRALDDARQEQDHAERLMAHWRLHHLLSALPQETAGLLRMRFQLSLSQREIAERTGIPLGTVKSRMANGLARLRDEMEDEG